MTTNPLPATKDDLSSPRGWGGIACTRALPALLIVIAINVLMLATPLSSTDSLKRATADANHTCEMNRTWPWWIANGYFKQPNAPEVLIFGSSLVNAVIWTADAKALNKTLDCIVHRRSNVLEHKLEEKLKRRDLSIVNCSISGAMASDDYVMAKALVQESQAPPKLFIIGVAPRDFIDSGLPDLRSTDAYRFFSRYIRDDSIKPLLYPTLFGRIANEGRELYESLPIRRVRLLAETVLSSIMLHLPGSVSADQSPSVSATSGASSVSAAAAKESNVGVSTGGETTAGAAPVDAAALMARARLMGAAGTGQEDRIEPGLALLPAEFPDVFIDNSIEYAKRYRKPFSELYGTEMLFFEKFLAFAREKRTRVIVIGMPLRPENRALLAPQFWQDYHTRLDAICTTYGATFFNVVDDNIFKQADFVDTVHLNTRGANKLLSILSEKISNTPEIARALRSSTSIAQTGAQQ